MPDRIKQLKIDGFRGATQPLDLKFDENKPVVLIFGHQGRRFNMGRCLMKTNRLC